jgi:hypothetical protein
LPALLDGLEVRFNPMAIVKPLLAIAGYSCKKAADSTVDSSGNSAVVPRLQVLVGNAQVPLTRSLAVLLDSHFAV